MSNQNNETNNTIGLAAVFGLFAMIASGIIVVAIALFLTLIAILAQFRPMSFQGEPITAKDGRRFILYGLLGMLPVALALAQLAVAIEHPIPSNWAWAPLLLGYSIAALSISWFVETFFAKPAAPVPPPTPTAPLMAPPPRPQSYEFAAWDDEVDPYK